MREEEFIEPTREGRRNAILLLVALSCLALAFQFLILPALKEYLISLPPCEQIEATRKILTGLAFLPLGLTLLFAPRASRMLRLGQTPLPGDWIIQRRPVRRGWRVKCSAYLMLLLPVLVLPVSLYTNGLASEISNGMAVRHKCAPR